MKKMKKFLSMLLASAMTFAMAAPGFAAEGKGSITITNATNGRTYNAYKLFEANPSGDGNGENARIAYTATADQVKILVEGYDDKAANLKVGESLTDGYITYTKTSGSADYNVEKKDGVSDEEVITYLNSFFDEPVTTGEKEFATTAWTVKDKYKSVLGEGKTGTVSNGKVEFTNLDYGYYFVTSSLGTALTITSTNRDAVVIDKNQGPHWDDEDPGDGGKKIIQVNGVNTKVNGNDAPVEEVSANYGDVITYEVKFQATDYAKEKAVIEYYLKDVLAPGMSYQTDSNNNVAVKVTVKDGTQELAASAYTVKTTVNDTNNQFELRIPWSTKGDDGKITFKYPFTDSVQTVTVTYSAVVTDEAVISGNGNKNTVSLSYWTDDQTPKDPDPENPDPNDPHKVTEDKETTTYVYALAINKTDQEGNGLPGAVFTLTDNTDAKNPIYVRDGGTDTNGNQIYLYDQPAKTPDPQNPQTNQVTSPANGVIVIKGIEEGAYVLTEITAPNGYNLLEGSRVINSVKTGEAIKEKETKTIYYDEKGEVTEEVTEKKKEVIIPDKVELQTDALVNIINKAGTILPSTGGIGTTIFYAAGIILMAGAVFFVVRRKRA